MTEEDAKSKWCPFTREVSMDGDGSTLAEVSYNRTVNRSARQVNVPPSTRCVGADCMAWRQTWVERGPVIERRRALPNSKRPEGDDWGYEAIDPNGAALGGEWVRWAPGVSHGFCGLAGAPQ